MAQVDDFLAEILPALRAADHAIHDGDAAPRKALWSHEDPVTLFGAAMAGSGWDQVEPIFDRLAERFSDCRSFEIEVVAAGASGDLAYLVAIERTTASAGGAPAAPYSLRVTSVFRREGGRWRVVHRHADPPPEAAEAAREQLRRLKGD